MAGKDKTKKMGCVEKKNVSKTGRGKKMKDLKEKKKKINGDDSNAAQQQNCNGKRHGKLRVNGWALVESQ